MVLVKKAGDWRTMEFKNHHIKLRSVDFVGKKKNLLLSKSLNMIVAVKNLQKSV